MRRATLLLNISAVIDRTNPASMIKAGLTPAFFSLRITSLFDDCDVKERSASLAFVIGMGDDICALTGSAARKARYVEPD